MTKYTGFVAQYNSCNLAPTRLDRWWTFKYSGLSKSTHIGL